MHTAKRSRIEDYLAKPSKLGRLKLLLKNVRGSRTRDELRFNVPVWDERAFDDLKALGDPDLLKSLVRKCFDDADDRLNQLRKARIGGQRDVWRESAHGMHGIALYLGATRLSQAIGEVLNVDNFDQAAESEADFARYLVDVRDVLTRFLT